MGSWLKRIIKKADAPIPRRTHGSEAYFALAQATLEAGDAATAEKVIRDGLSAHPGTGGFHLFLGRLLASRGELEEGYLEMKWDELRGGAAKGDAGTESAELVRKHPERDGLQSLSAAFTTNGESSRMTCRAFRQDLKDRVALLAREAELSRSDAERSELDRLLIELDGSFAPALRRLALVARTSGSDAEAAALERQARDAERLLSRQM